ncbi:unnamed protein product [Gadus morhua 'NCC']
MKTSSSSRNSSGNTSMSSTNTTTGSANTGKATSHSNSNSVSNNCGKNSGGLFSTVQLYRQSNKLYGPVFTGAYDTLVGLTAAHERVWPPPG